MPDPSALTGRRKRARPAVPGRLAESFSVECKHLSGTMCQRDIGCCRGLPACPYAQAAKPGDILYHMGDENTGLHQVLSGIVGLVLLDSQGRQALIGLVRPGELFGQRSLIYDDGHSCTALALTACQIWSVPHRLAKRMYLTDQHFRDQILAELSRELINAHQIAQQAVSLSIADRLLRLFLELGRQIGTPDDIGGLRVLLPLPYHEIATLMGHPPESISRTLSRMAREGEILFDRTSVHLPAATIARLESEDQGGL